MLQHLPLPIRVQTVPFVDTGAAQSLPACDPPSVPGPLAPSQPSAGFFCTQVSASLQSASLSSLLGTLSQITRPLGNSFPSIDEFFLRIVVE